MMEADGTVRIEEFDILRDSILWPALHRYSYLYIAKGIGYSRSPRISIVFTIAVCQ